MNTRKVKLINYRLPDGRIITKNPDMRVLSKNLPEFQPTSKPKFQIERHALKEKMAILKEHMKSCDLCFRNCQVNRLNGERGYCGLGKEAYFYQVNLSIWEEKINPCWVVALYGCESHCIFCSWPETLDLKNNEKIPIEKLWQYIEPPKYNIMFSGAGSPIPSVYSILKFLNSSPPDFSGQIIWKSNFVENPLIYELFPADIWVMDIKFGNDKCASKLMTDGIRSYCSIIKQNLERLVEKKERVIIRILLLPGHSKCCTKNIFNLIHPFRNHISVSINPDFIPEYRSAEFGLAQFVSAEEKNFAFELAENLRFTIIQ
ncbi:MAG: hypothetical protein ABIL66_08885 [candidate division WOR-3 bacterium]